MDLITEEERKQFILSGCLEHKNKKLLNKLANYTLTIWFGGEPYLTSQGWDQVLKYSCLYNLLAVQNKNSKINKHKLLRIMNEHLPEEVEILKDNFSDDQWYLSYQERYSNFPTSYFSASYFSVRANFYNEEDMDKYLSLANPKSFQANNEDRAWFYFIDPYVDEEIMRYYIDPVTFENGWERSVEWL